MIYTKNIVNLKNIKPVKGIVNVELFDISGKKVLEEKSKNSLTYIAMNRLKWSVKQNFFMGHPSYPSFEPPFPFSYIMLDSSIGSTVYTSSKLYKNIGPIIGWCDKSSVSTLWDTQGVINTIESYWSNRRVRWVFDFSTQNANGTFQKIVWGDGGIEYTLGTLQSINHPARTGRGIAWDGKYLWTIGEYERLIYQIDPITGSVFKYYPVQWGMAYPQSIAYDGNYLWITAADGKIRKINPKTGALMDQLPGSYTSGITWDGSYLRVANNNTYTIDKIDSSNGNLINSIPYPQDAYIIIDIAWDGDNLWYIDRGTYSGNKLYKINPDTGEVLAKISSGSNVSKFVGVTCDDTSLWVIQFNPRTLVKVDVNIGSIVRLPNPVTKTNDKTMKVTYDFIFEE